MKYLMIDRTIGEEHLGKSAFISDITNLPDLEDHINFGEGDVIISEGENGEMSWEWDDKFIIKTGFDTIEEPAIGEPFQDTDPDQ